MSQGSGVLLFLSVVSGFGLASTAAMEDRPSAPPKASVSPAQAARIAAQAEEARIAAIAAASSGDATAAGLEPKEKLRRFLTQKVFPDQHPCAKPGEPGYRPKTDAEEAELAAAKEKLRSLVVENDSPGRQWLEDVATLPGLPFSGEALRGHRTYMEDYYDIAAGGRFAAVYDGHGGARVASFLKEALYKQVLHQMRQFSSSPERAGGSGQQLPPPRQTELVAQAFSRALARIEAGVVAEKKWRYQGSTVTACVLVNEGDRRFAVTANVGDSRVVLSRGGQAVELTRDHKPNSPSELARIQALGGTVDWYGYVDGEGQPVEGTGVYRVNGNLAVSRAVGDAAEKPFVSAVPDVRVVDLDVGGGGGGSGSSSSSSSSGSSSAEDEFIILASDGLWDVMTSDEAVRYVHGILGGRDAETIGATSLASRADVLGFFAPTTALSDANKAVSEFEIAQRKKNMARSLIDEAMRRGTSDNVTALVLWLK
jgi:serine/threonine protein phosphatase PrpC